jgi:predicted PP-loop superfamily ATPase
MERRIGEEHGQMQQDETLLEDGAADGRMHRCEISG